MTNSKISLAIALSLGTVLVVSGAARPAYKKQGLTCPVTRLSIPSPRDAVGVSTYKGKKYYFCTAHCKKLFDSNPGKYATK